VPTATIKGFSLFEAEALSLFATKFAAITGFFNLLAGNCSKTFTFSIKTCLMEWSNLKLEDVPAAVLEILERLQP